MIKSPSEGENSDDANSCGLNNSNSEKSPTIPSFSHKKRNKTMMTGKSMSETGRVISIF